jgi:subtilisin family serine protease
MAFRWRLGIPFVVLLVGTAASPVPSAYASPGHIRRALDADRIPNQYIVILQNVSATSAPSVAAGMASQYGGKLRLTMNNAAVAFSVEMTEPQALALTYDPRVLLVEENRRVYPSTHQTLPADGKLWNLDRIDQRYSAVDPNTYLYRDFSYNYCEQASDVIAYILDTGINKDHQEFLRPGGGSRVINGISFANDYYIRPGDAIDYGTWPCGGWTDNYTAGHGTSVASILGGNTLGVAKGVTLVPLRVIRCDGWATTEWLCWALDWIKTTGNPNRDHRPALVNISLRTFDTDSFVGALESVVNGIVLDSPGWTGIPVIVSANNQRSANSRTSPARMAYTNAAYFISPGRVISAGGTAENDARWQCVGLPAEACNSEVTVDGTYVDGGSNYGFTVDIYAPAHNIESAHIACSSCVRVGAENRAGTSFAAPLVSGVVARMLEVNPALTPVQIWQQLQADATHVGFPIDSVTFNDMVVFRAGSATCFPEYP